MQITTEVQGDVTIVAIDDHLDTASSPQLEAALLKCVDDGARRLLIDCTKLEYVNSAGLKVFLLLAKKLETLDGQFAICGLNSSVLMIFEMIGFTRIMRITETRQEGVKALREAPTGT